MRLDYVFYCPRRKIWFDHFGEPMVKNRAIGYNERIKRMLTDQKLNVITKTVTRATEIYEKH